MAVARNISGSGSAERKTDARRKEYVYKTNKEVVEVSASDRINHVTRNMDRLAPKTRAKLDAYQAEGHANLPRDNFNGLTAEQIRARILGL